jgi:hypothetical protein
MNDKYPRKHENPVGVGISMDASLRNAAKARAAFHNDKAKLSPYLCDLIKLDLEKGPAPGQSKVLKAAFEYLKTGEGSRSEIIKMISEVRKAYD